MHLPHPPAFPVALVAAAGVLLAVWTVQRQEPRRDAVVAAPAITDVAAGSRLAHCRENVALIQDVTWAAACVVQADELRRAARNCARGAGTGACPPDEEPDDSPDCTLGWSRAAALNRARDAADAQCFAEARRPASLQ